MLRHDHVDGQRACHVGPQAQHLVGHHVAAVKRFHFRDMGGQRGDGLGRVGRGAHGHAEVARKQDAADRVPKLEVAFGVHEVRRQRHDFAATQADAHAGVGNADDAALRFAGLAKVRRKPFPQARNVERGLGAGHPAVERGNDVRVGVRGQDHGQFLRRKIAAHREQQLVVGHVAAGVDDGAGVAVDHQKLVGLHRFTALVAEVGKHEAHMAVLVEQFDRHGGSSGVGRWGSLVCDKGGPTGCGRAGGDCRGAPGAAVCAMSNGWQTPPASPPAVSSKCAVQAAERGDRAIRRAAPARWPCRCSCPASWPAGGLSRPGESPGCE